MSEKSYKVLARRTRPTKFSELIGQESLVKTIKNALLDDRMAHAFIFTGTRGVGKTTTARLIALSLNCVGKDGKGAITSEPCGLCEQCVSIQEDRHVDVMEVDAATRTGVDDVRQLMDGMSYKPVMGRYKVYIIDEVHMLSKSAFNALLKTLEEPPAHVKFIFATTEIRKVPLTILSRCQRFDLKRVSVEALVSHFSSVLTKENVKFERDAVERVAVLANGSVRDGLSILEQIITQLKDKSLTLPFVEEALGLLDHREVEMLFQHMLKGEVKGALECLSNLYTVNADPTQILEDLLSVTHKAIQSYVSNQAKAEESTELGDLSLDALMLVWSVLVKGVEEIKVTPLVLETLEVILIRAMYIQGFRSGKSDPTEMPVKKIEGFKSHYKVESFKDIISLMQKKKEPIIADYLINDVGLISFKPGALELCEVNKEQKDLRAQLPLLLRKFTDQEWEVIFSTATSAPTLKEQQNEIEAARRKEALSTDAAKTVNELFPGAKINVK